MDPVIATDETNNSQTEDCHHGYSIEFVVASILMLAYIIESAVQIFLIFDCYHSSYLPVTSNWLWVLFLTWLITSLLVTITSIVWISTGMDFSGRLCGKLLCYLMHCLLLGVLWRYLKIALAYEKADAEEFFKLRSLQIYIQALPLLVIHLVYLNAPFQGYENLAAWMVGGELLSALISLTFHSLIKSESNSLCESDSTAHKTPLTLEANVISRILLLISRVIAVGLFVSLTSYWSVLAILVHLLICQTWLFLFITVCPNGRANDAESGNSNDNSTTTSNKNKWGEAIIINDSKCLESDVKNDYYYDVEVNANTPVDLVICTYVLFWDVNSTIVGGINLRFLSLPVLLVLAENVAIVIFYLYCQTTIFLTVVSGTCLLCGWMLLVIVTTWNKWTISLIHSHNGNGTGSIKDAFLNDTTSHSHSHSNLGFLPVVDPHSIYNMNDITNNAVININTNNNTRTITKGHYVVSSCNYENEDCGKLKRKSGLGRNISGGSSSHKNGQSREGLQGTNSSNTVSTNILQPSLVINDYQRINESLMTTVKKVASCNKQQLGMKQEPHHHASWFSTGNSSKTIFRKIISPGFYENKCGSTSSRNTNTISSDSIPQNQNDEISSDFYDPEYEKEVEIIDATKNQVVGISNYHHQQNCRRLSNESNEIYKIHQKSPPQIRRASKVLLNHPKHHSTPEPNSQSRCCCIDEDECGEESHNRMYEKLIEDAYGILICEGEPTRRSGRLIKPDRICSSHSTSMFHSGKRLKVLCAKCLENHDPLLTDCIVKGKNDGTPRIINVNYFPSLQVTNRFQKSGLLAQQKIPNAIHSSRGAPSETTEYPTDTEFTYNVPEGDELSVSTYMSTVQSVSYANLPIQSQLFSQFLSPKNVPRAREIPKEFTGTEYVKAWLRMNDGVQVEGNDVHHENVNRNSNNTNDNDFNSFNRLNCVGNLNTKLRLGNNEREEKRIHFTNTPRPRSAQCKRDKRVNYQNNNLQHPVFNMTFQPPPKQKQHPIQAFALPHNQNQLHQHHHRNSPGFEKYIFQKGTNDENLPQEFREGMMHLEDDLLETIV